MAIETKQPSGIPSSQLAGSDLRITWLELNCESRTVHLSPYLINMNLYEDLWGNFISADVMLNDSVNLPLHGPVVGHETLNFKFGTKSLDDIRAASMQLTSIKKRYITKERQQVYMLHFISEQATTNANTTISRSWRGKKISDIVTDIMLDYLDPEEVMGDPVIEQTKGIENIVIPNWKPHDALNWLAKRAINQNDCANYLFYELLNREDDDPYMVFKSIDSILSQDPVHKFVYSAAVEETKKQGSQFGTAGITELLDLKIVSQFNLLENMNEGYYASKLITHDILKKKITQHTHSIRDIFAANINHTDRYMPLNGSTDTEASMNDTYSFAPEENMSVPGDTFCDQFDSKIIFHPKHDKMYAKNTGDLYDNNVENWKLNRRSLIQGLGQIKLQIAMTGMSFIHAGDVINVSVPSPQRVIEEKPGMVKNKDELIDGQLSGKYLITSLKHCFTKEDNTLKYIQKALVIKDGLGVAP